MTIYATYNDELVKANDPINTLVAASSTALAKVSRAVLVGAAGTVVCTMRDGSVVTLTLGAGWHPIACTKVVLGTATAVFAGW